MKQLLEETIAREAKVSGPFLLETLYLLDLSVIKLSWFFSQVSGHSSGFPLQLNFLL